MWNKIGKRRNCKACLQCVKVNHVKGLRRRRRNANLSAAQEFEEVIKLNTGTYIKQSKSNSF